MAAEGSCAQTPRASSSCEASHPCHPTFLPKQKVAHPCPSPTCSTLCIFYRDANMPCCSPFHPSPEQSFYPEHPPPPRAYLRTSRLAALVCPLQIPRAGGPALLCPQWCLWHIVAQINLNLKKPVVTGQSRKPCCRGRDKDRLYHGMPPC